MTLKCPFLGSVKLEKKLKKKKKPFCPLEDPILKHTKTKCFEIFLAVSIDFIKE